jgi:acetyltransferase-like isoleucine patch superfamily enzyme
MSAVSSQSIKCFLVKALQPAAKLWRVVMAERATRIWALARLQEGVGRQVHPSNVVLGPVELHGTRQVSLGQRALIYPGVYLETQGHGHIDIGDDVVLSRGVHLVAFDRIVLGRGVMVGEYSSLRDADHRRSETAMRYSGHVSAAIHVEPNVWIARGVTVLKGVTLGEGSVVGANAVVTRNVSAGSVVAGVPAKLIPVGVHGAISTAPNKEAVS